MTGLQKKAIESLYTGRCSIVEHQMRYNREEGQDEETEVFVKEGIPCRVSYKSTPNTTQSDSGAGLLQTICLFLPPDIKVTAGSKLVVEQAGRREVYSCAGQPAVYSSHQEVELKLERKWA